MRKCHISDPDECRTLWNRLITPRNISDLWEFRLCFHRHINNMPCFLVLEDKAGIAAMLPLSFAEEVNMFVFFPGEIWNGKTWIERTPIYLRRQQLLEEILSFCPDRTFLRYMEPGECDLPQDFEIDETGYVLYPPLLDFDFEGFRRRFANKRYKDIIRVIRNFTEHGGLFFVNRLRDFDRLVEMSIGQFGTGSYLYDDRFRRGFRDLVHFLHGRGWLRMVSLEIKGKTVAVDLGSVFGGTYTVFLGGTDPEFRGVAKVMNMHHIEFAFRERVSKIDFLCGDFHWKKLWHLDPEPLYKILSPSLRCLEDLDNALPYEDYGLVNEGWSNA